MKSSFKKQKGSKINVAVTLGTEDVKPHFDRALEKALQNVDLKGFRPGMAPKELAEAAIDRRAVMEHAVQDAIRHSLNSVIEEQAWEVIDAPQVKVDSDEKKAVTDKGFSMPRNSRFIRS